MRRYSSGQREQTVNLLTSVFVGSNPTRRTKTELKGFLTCQSIYVILYNIVLFFENRTTRKRKEGYMKYRFMVVILLMSSLPYLIFAQWKQGQIYAFSSQEAIDLVNQLFTAVNPASPENSYMPSFMKDKIRWAYIQHNTHTLQFKFISDEKNELGRILMRSSYQKRLPTIEIVANRLLMIIRVQEKVAFGFNQMQKNTFALGLTHEVVHLEQTESFFTTKETRTKFINEEFRVAKKVDKFAVTPLLDAGQPIEVDFEDMHKIFQGCGMAKECPAFTVYLDSNSGSQMPK